MEFVLKMQQIKKQGKDISLLSPVELANTALNPGRLAELRNAFFVLKKKNSTNRARFHFERQKKRDKEQEKVRQIIEAIESIESVD